MSEALQEQADHGVRPAARRMVTPMSAVSIPDAGPEPGVGVPADAATGDVATVTAILRAVQETALALVEGAGTQPQRVRVKVHGVSVELDWRQRAAREITVLPTPPAVSASAPVTAGDAPSAPAPATTAPSASATGAPSAPADLHYICAPSVGTFYHAPEPGAAPLVTAGDPVSKGQPVGIVEAMKLMLPVEADRVGHVVEVLVEDGTSVEFGERLILISTSAPAGRTPGGDRG